MKTLDLVVYAAIGVGAYVLYKKIGVPITDTLHDTGSYIGLTLYDWLHQEPSSYETYGVTFPDGSVRAVNSEDIDSNGYFRYWRDGTSWRIGIGSDGHKYAVPA